MHIPPTAPPKPPMPTTEPTARRGNMSEAVVNILHDHPWCAAVAKLNSATWGQRLLKCGISTTGTTQMAQISIAVLREWFTLHPRLIKLDESDPPEMLPTSAARYMTTKGGPICVSVS